MAVQILRSVLCSETSELNDLMFISDDQDVGSA